MVLDTEILFEVSFECLGNLNLQTTTPSFVPCFPWALAQV